MAVNYFGADNSVGVASVISTGDNTLLGFYDIQRKRLKKFADQYVNEKARPVETLISAGSTTTTPEVAATRRGFQDFRRMMVLTQWFAYSGQTQYRDHAIEMILDWARENVPDGHPINQTNFEPMHHCIPVLRPHMTTQEQTTMDNWLNAIRVATENWNFPLEPGGGTLRYGNHYTHHYMQLLLCYKSLNLTTQFNNLLTTIDQHAIENFPFGNPAVIHPNTYAITQVHTHSKRFRIAGAHASEFSTSIYPKIYLQNSSGYLNDGWYTLVSADSHDGHTDIYVAEDIPSNSVSGVLVASYDDSIHDMPYPSYAAGMSIDRIRRDALHYQIYDVQPWLEIAIAEGGTRYLTVMENAYNWTKEWFFNPPFKHYEFTDSVDDFDALRWEGSRAEYLQPTAMVLPWKFCRIVFQYYRYRQTIDSSFVVAPEDVSVALRSDIIPTNWPYWFRWILGLL